MNRFLFTILALIVSISVASAQNSLIIKYEGDGMSGLAGMLPSEANKARSEVISKLQQNFLTILVESAPNKYGVYKPAVVWIYLNDTKHPRHYHDTSHIKSDYLGQIELFCINLSPKLRFILKRKGTRDLLNEIGGEYNIDENGYIVSIIDYDKLEKYVYN